MSKSEHPLNRIKELRIRAGLTTSQLGEKIGITQSGLSRIENGQVATTLDILYRIAAALNVRPKDLLDEPKESSFSLTYENGTVVVAATLVESADVERLIAQLDRICERLHHEESQRKDKVVSLRSLPPKAENGGNE